MIDTDKYEGHTEGPWELIPNYEEGWDNTWEGRVHLFTTLGIGIDKKSLSATDAQLIADAPLLLAEVKRLHEILEWMTDSTEPPEGWGQELPPDGTAWPWPPSDYAMNEIARLALEGKTYLEIWEGLQ